MTKKLAVKKAIEAIDSGDARGLRKHINEALVAKVRKALNKKEKDIAKNLIESATKQSLQERNDNPVDTPSKTNIPVANAQCVVIHTGDDYSEFTGKKVVSGLKKGDKFTATSTNDILSKLKCTKHQIQKDELKDIKAGAKTLYVFVCPFHAQENQERVAQIFADPKEAQDWYDEARNYGAPMDVWR